MECLDSYPVRSLPPLDGPLLSLGDAFVDRFHSWHGASGTRYVMSVFAADPASPDLGLPVFETCVILPVVRVGRTRRVTGVLALERGSDRRRVLAGIDARGVDEWHVHLLADDRRARAAVVTDLRARHGDDRHVLSA